RRSHRLHPHLIDIAPQPVLSRFIRSDQRVPGGVEMLGGVLVLRLVAAADMAAAEAQPEMDPWVTGLQALLAAIGVRFEVSDLVEVRAGDRHSLLRPSFLVTVS